MKPIYLNQDKPQPSTPHRPKASWGIVCTTLAGLLAGSPLAAAPLQPADVPHEPAWVLHFDLDAFRQTSLGQQILTELQKEEHRKKLDAFQAMFRFDPRTALHGLTLYSPTKAQEDGVLLVYADVDAAQLTALAQGAKDHQTLAHGSHTIHHWIDEKRSGSSGTPARTYAAIYQSRVVLFGQRAQRVMEALDLLDRRQPNLSTNTRLVSALPKNAFLVGVARGGGIPGDDPQAAVFRRSSLLTLSITEATQQIHGRLALETEGEEAAVQIENIVRGLIGLMALQQDKPETQRLARSLSVERNQNRVTLLLTLPVQEIIQQMQANAAARKP